MIPNNSIATHDTERIFERIIETLPLPVKYGELHFLAQSVGGPRFTPHSEEYYLILQNYCTEGITRSIGPFRIQRRDYVSDIQDAGVDMLLRDEKTKMIKVDLGHHGSGVNGFHAFKQSLFPILKEAGYQVELGELTLSSYQTSGLDSNPYTTSVVRVDKGGAFMDIGPDFEKSARPVLVEWFSELKRYIELK